jgi:hypothetical protein
MPRRPPPEALDPRAAYRRRLAAGLFVRWHMTLILAGVVGAGIAVSKGLLLLGVGSLGLRWSLAVVASYLVFFALVRCWIAVVVPAAKARRGGDGTAADGGDWLDLGVGGARGDAPPPLHAGGGRFGGGGASMSLDAGAPAPAPSGGASSSGSWLGGLDADDGAFWILAVLGLVLLLLFGIGAYVVYQAPAILADAAFEVVLASGLARASRRLARAGWAGSLFRATVLPFAAVLIGSGLAGGALDWLCPAASRLAEVFHRCL